jgi:hypothetical protein
MSTKSDPPDDAEEAPPPDDPPPPDDIPPPEEPPRRSAPPRVSSAPRASVADAPSRAWIGIVGFGALIAVGAFAVLRAPIDQRLPPHEEPSATAVPAASASAAPAPRCQRIGTTQRVGKSAAPPPRTPTPNPDNDDQGDDEALGAFGAEVGRAAAIDGAFAVGVREDKGDGATAAVLTLGTDGAEPKLVPLGKSRGDFDAPLVVARGAGWLAGTLEPAASDLSLRIASGARGAEAKWGAEIAQRHDESLAFDIAAGRKAIVTAWDEVDKDGKLSRVAWAVLAPDAAKINAKPSIASAKDVDADTPRVIAREGGFWLAYIARHAVELGPNPDDAALGRTPKEQADDDPEARARHPAEKIDPSWIELMPLDEAGASAGAARAITPKDGHVLGFDLRPGASGAVLVAWRDDDTPSGAHGGRVSLMTVAASGGTETQLVAAENVGSGVPSLFAGWIALSDAAGRATLAPVGEDGTLAGELRIEPAIGTGDPIAAQGNRLLVASSAGTAVDVFVVECKP